MGTKINNLFCNSMLLNGSFVQQLSNFWVKRVFTKLWYFLTLPFITTVSGLFKITLRKILQFHLISWCRKAEKHSFRIVLSWKKILSYNPELRKYLNCPYDKKKLTLDLLSKTHYEGVLLCIQFDGVLWKVNAKIEYLTKYLVFLFAFLQ